MRPDNMMTGTDDKRLRRVERHLWILQGEVSILILLVLGVIGLG